jgi:transposase
MITHQPYPSDVSDAEWEFVVPYLCLLPEDAGQRVHNLRDVLDALRWIVRTGSPWRYLPKDFPPWEMVYQQSRRWLAAVIRIPTSRLFASVTEDQTNVTGALNDLNICRKCVIAPSWVAERNPSARLESGLSQLIILNPPGALPRNPGRAALVKWSLNLV